MYPLLPLVERFKLKKLSRGDKMGMLRVTQTKSIIKTMRMQKLTIKALGLGRPNYFKILPDNPQTWGMIRKVEHLVKVEKLPD